MLFFRPVALRQAERLELCAVPGAAGGHIKPGCIDAGMPKDIRQVRDILFLFIEAAGKQVAQVVREALPLGNAGLPAQPAHGRPDIAPVQRPPAPSDKDHPRVDALLLGIAVQGFAQGAGEQDHPDLSLVADHGAA